MKAFLLSVCCLALFNGNTLNLEQSILKDARVECLQMLVQNNVIVIALKTQPIFLRSENVDILNLAKHKANLQFASHTIYVSIDSESYIKLTQIKQRQDFESGKLSQLLKQMQKKEVALLN